MTLRQKAISALWRGFGVDLPNAEYGDMADALDEMLDCLTENADEWVGQAGWLPSDIATGNVRRDLLPVLREDR